MRRVYLLAHPAGHSLSPAMHNAAFKHLSMSARYEALDVSPEDLPDAVAALRASEVWGANVTIPHKLNVLPLVDRLSAAAQAIGAVNTVVNRSGELFGDNTDAAGFLRGLESADTELQGKKVVMLGAGGAARAVLYALLSAGAQVYLHNRTREKAHVLSEAFSSLGPSTVLTDEALGAVTPEADGLVNTTSVGMERGGTDPDVSPLKLRDLPRRGFVCDLIYRPAQTRLLRDAAAKGVMVQNGLPMLVYQGAEAFKLWTGQDAPTEVMFSAVHRFD